MEGKARMAIGIGAYNLQEAARYTGIDVATISRWLFRENPLWTTQLIDSGWRGIGFHDLLELRIVQKLRESGVSLQAIRLSIKNAKEIFGREHPFVNKRFFTDGKGIFSEAIKKTGSADDPLMDLTKRQLVLDSVIRPSLLDGVVFDSNQDAILWHPNRKTFRGVVLDPSRSFGKSIIDTVGIKTSVLYDSFIAEKDRKLVARIYEIPVQAVNLAIRYEESLNNRKAA